MLIENTVNVFSKDQIDQIAREEFNEDEDEMLRLRDGVTFLLFLVLSDQMLEQIWRMHDILT